MRKIVLRIGLLIGLMMLVLTGCSNSGKENVATKPASKSEQVEEENTMRLYINDKEVEVTWDENDTVREIQEQTAAGDIVVDMSMYGGWEQVGSLGRSYSRKDTRITAECGDIVLYSGNQIVVFYGSNTWEYTHLGKMNLSEGEVKELLAGGDVTLKVTAN